MFCGSHKERIAIAQCVRCGKGVCTECQVNDHGYIFCRDCTGMGWRGAKWRSSKHPIIPTVLALFLPGMGQVYNGQASKGIAIFLTSWLILPWLYGIADAYLIGKKISRGDIPSQASSSNFIGCLFLLIMFFVSPFILGDAVKKYIFQIQIVFNQNETQKILHQIANACESYLHLHQRYPLSYSDLYFHKPPLIQELYCDVPYNGYVFNCLFFEKGYSITAKPTAESAGLKEAYLLTTGDTLTFLKSDGRPINEIIKKDFNLSLPPSGEKILSDKLNDVIGNLQRGSDQIGR